MFSQETIKGFINFLTQDLAVFLLPSMLFVFCVGVGLRFLVYFTVSRELWFAKEFYKRSHEYLDTHGTNSKNPHDKGFINNWMTFFNNFRFYSNCY